MTGIEPGIEAYRLSLRAIRAVLEAAHPFDFEVEGCPIHVSVDPLPSPGWPRLLTGLDQVQDGPWPAPVRIRASWEGGSVEMNAVVSAWPPSDARFPDYLGVGVRVQPTNREISWFTVTSSLVNARDVATAPILARVRILRQEGEDVAIQGVYFLRLMSLLRGLGLATNADVPVFHVHVPSGEVHPSPATGFENLVKVAIIRAPFQLRGESEGIQGESPFSIGATTQRVLPVQDRRAALWPLPGGVYGYKKALDSLLEDLDGGGLDFDAFSHRMTERFETHGTSAPRGYWALVANTGLAASQQGRLELTDAGTVYLADPRPEALFTALHHHWIGILETLVLCEAPRSLAIFREALNRLLDTSWETAAQASFRRNWLLSLGLVDRQPEGDLLTDAGRAVLASYPDEVAAIRVRLGTLQSGDGETGLGPTDIIVVEPPPLVDRLDLRPSQVRIHLDRQHLRFPPALVAQACAALTAEKHLLLVGPPGTGKTELALALAAAAMTEGYCTGCHTATASADWTTFDTIGGYMLHPDAMRFRPGAFPLALERGQWLLVDEVNRADIDRSFGELMTVLTGKTVQTAYTLPDGRTVSMGPDPSCTHRVFPAFRLLATMNTWDKTSLFRLSYALQRRFAILHVGLPDAAMYADLLRFEGIRDRWNLPPLPPAVLTRVLDLFSPQGLLAVRPLGPALALDVIRYLRVRGPTGEAMAEALAMGVLNQLEGLDEKLVPRAWATMVATLGSWASDESIDTLKERFQEIFPHVALPKG